MSGHTRDKCLQYIFCPQSLLRKDITCIHRCQQKVGRIYCYCIGRCYSQILGRAIIRGVQNVCQRIGNNVFVHRIGRNAKRVAPVHIAPYTIMFQSNSAGTLCRHRNAQLQVVISARFSVITHKHRPELLAVGGHPALRQRT